MNYIEMKERLESEMTFAVCRVVLNDLLDIQTTENHEEVLKKWVKKHQPKNNGIGEFTVNDLVKKVRYIYGSAFDIWKEYTKRKDYVDNDGFVSAIINEYDEARNSYDFNYKATLAHIAHWNVFYNLFGETSNMSNVTIHFVPTKTNCLADCFHGKNLLLFSQFMVTYRKENVDWYEFEESILKEVKEECDLTLYFDRRTKKLKFKVKG